MISENDKNEMCRMRRLGFTLDYIAKADVLIIGGTSLVVYPAAGLVRCYRGSKLVVINKDATNMDSSAALCISAPIGEVLGQL